ncbi:hypothetical protein YC2023_028501 [Brassica napus]
MIGKDEGVWNGIPTLLFRKSSDAQNPLKFIVIFFLDKTTIYLDGAVVWMQVNKTEESHMDRRSRRDIDAKLIQNKVMKIGRSSPSSSYNTDHTKKLSKQGDNKDEAPLAPAVGFLAVAGSSSSPPLVGADILGVLVDVSRRNPNSAPGRAISGGLRPLPGIYARRQRLWSTASRRFWFRPR